MKTAKIALFKRKGIRKTIINIEVKPQCYAISG